MPSKIKETKIIRDEIKRIFGLNIFWKDSEKRDSSGKIFFKNLIFENILNVIPKIFLFVIRDRKNIIMIKDNIIAITDSNKKPTTNLPYFYDNMYDIR